MAGFVKPHTTRQADLNPLWHVIDATDKTLGRLCTEVATLLMGKHRTIFVRHMNTGDFVVIVNAAKIQVTGKKTEQKAYYRHSGYHGGITRRTLGDVMDSRPEQAVKSAVKGMLPKNNVGKNMLTRLKVYAGPDHPHEAQIIGSENAAKMNSQSTQEA